MSQHNKPLAGIKVVEFTHMVMGPTAGVILGDLGADVIKIEPLQGDNTRNLKGSGGGYFAMYNRNKSSLCIDLKAEEGIATAKDIIARSDIMIENFRPGAMDKLGLGYDTLSQSHPGLIYCSLKGFLSGPYEHRTALDEVTQMMGGLAYMTGLPEKPMRAGSSVIDITGGMFGVIGILAALQERHNSGRASTSPARCLKPPHLWWASISPNRAYWARNHRRCRCGAAPGRYMTSSPVKMANRCLSAWSAIHCGSAFALSSS